MIDVLFQTGSVRLSNKTQYAIRAVFDLAYYGRNRPAFTKEIGDRQGIPQRFLEQIFQDLRKHGLVDSKRGPRGGYIISKSPADLRVGDVVRAIEGNIRVVSERDESERTPTDTAGTSVVDRTLNELARHMEATLDATTFEDLIEQAEKEHASAVPPARYKYTI